MKQGWEIKKIKDICDKASSNIAQNKITELDGDYPVFGASGFVQNVDFYHRDTEYIGIVKDGSGVGRVNTYPAYSSLLGTLQYIIPKEGYLLNYVSYALKSLNLSEYASGAAIPHIYFKDYGKAVISVPPMEEQEKIVEELDCLSGVIEKKREQLKELDALAESIFYTMFGDPEHSKYEIVALREIAAEIGDGLHGTPQYDDCGDCYFINGNNLIDGKIEISNTTKKVNSDTKQKYFISLTNRSILVSINGTLGKTAYYNGENVILGKSACYISLKNDVSKEYVYFLLGSKYFKTYASNNATGSTIRNVSLKSMREFPIPLPPNDLQVNFVAKIALIEKQKQLIKESIAQTEELFNSRMAYYFN